MAHGLVLFIESNTSGTGRLFAQAARHLGFEPVLVSRQPERYPYVGADSVRTITADTQDLAALLRLIGEIQEHERIAGISSSSEYYVATAAALAASLGLPGPDAAAVKACRNKAYQRQRLAEAGVDRVRSSVVADIEHAKAAARTIGFPVVLKPVAGSGSIGVRCCRDLTEVEQHARHLLEADQAGGASDGLLVEEAIGGGEFSVEIFHDAVVGVTAKHLGALPYFVEIGHDFPAAIGNAQREQIGAFALAATRAMGLTWGPVHVELRADRASLHIMEINPRLAGGFIPELVRHATGIDLITNTLRLVTGLSLEVTSTRREHASIRFLTAPQDGVWQETHGVERARNLPGVIDLQLYRQAGEAVVRQGNFQDRLGHVIAVAPTANAAAGSAQAALASIRLVLADPAPPAIAMAG